MNLNTHTVTKEITAEKVDGKEYVVITTTTIEKKFIEADKYQTAIDARLAAAQADKVDIDAKIDAVK